MRMRGDGSRMALLVAGLTLLLAACAPSDHPYSTDPGAGWGERLGSGGGGNR